MMHPLIDEILLVITMNVVPFRPDQLSTLVPRVPVSIRHVQH